MSRSPAKMYRSGTTVLRDHAKLYGATTPYYAAEQLPRVVASVAKLRDQEQHARARGDLAKAQKLGAMVAAQEIRAQFLAALITSQS